ncbi:MAG: nucleoside 2-deoxyribosyltransferase [Oscillospiraceae bacterium]|nr:nucleoside 2-deoxyribosyltransferase [Oscillospiraceae bacterium]
MKIYLASPFFNDEELKNVETAEKILMSRGFDVFSPRLNEVRTDENTKQSWWSKETFMNDKKFIDWADVVVMLYYGGYSDSGTAWECGYAYGTNTPVIVVHLGEDSNLMVHEGCHSNITLNDLENYDFNMMPAKSYKGKMF